jgi:hypothetical protein
VVCSGDRAVRVPPITPATACAPALVGDRQDTKGRAWPSLPSSSADAARRARARRTATSPARGIVVEGVQRLAEFEHRVVGDVDQRRG